MVRGRSALNRWLLSHNTGRYTRHFKLGPHFPLSGATSASRGAQRKRAIFLRSHYMEAIRMIEPGKPLELQKIPIPFAGEEDVLVRVRAAGICHSDAHYRAGRSSMGRLPITLGHEIAGQVEWA